MPCRSSLILLCFFVALNHTSRAQEICNNGIDDDGDGLIDLQDPDCQCHYSVTNNLLRNGSFELYDHCPVIYTYTSNYNVATYWQYGSYVNYNEANFYHNLSCTYDSTQVILYLRPRLPLPDGDAFISILNTTYIDPIPENQIPKGYVGQCLQSTLMPGEEYTLSFYAGRFRSWDNLTGKIFPFTVAIFGNADCNAVPFGKINASGSGCPANYPGWMLLGKKVVHSAGEWVQDKINFTVPSPINVIEIGTDCSILPEIVDLTDSTTFLDYHLYYLDDLYLLPTKDFPFEYIHSQIGSGCNGTAPVLEAPTFSNATYQWYKDSIAIPGATGLTYQPESEENNYYNVLISTPGKCVITEPFLVSDTLNKITIPADTILCSNTSLTLAPAIDGITYTINGSPANNVTINKQGTYTITATNNFGCQRSFKTNVVEKNCSECELLVPNAFTPNGDGLNDIIKAKLFCNYSEFDFQIFNRWGEKIFESHNPGVGWDGTYLGSRMKSDVYVYFISYKTSSNVVKTVKGTLALIR